MAEAPYTQTAHLSDGHAKGVTALAFNSDGSLLATAGLDGTLCIWNASTWTLLDVYYAKQSISSVAWFTNNALICGLKDGIMTSVVKTDDTITHVSELWAHLYPIEWLAIRDKLVASGAHHELSVWEWNTNADMVHLVKGITPPRAHDDVGMTTETDNHNSDEEVLVTGVFWAANMLVVAYLHDGIILYDVENWSVVRTIDTNSTIVSSSLSPNGAYMAVSDPAVGFKVFDLDAAKPIRTFENDIGNQECAIPVFIHGGHAILMGSAVGRVNIWYVNASFRLPHLPIPNEQKVLAIAARYDVPSDRFIIATGLMDEHAPPSVIVWTSTAGGNAGGWDDEPDDEEDVDHVDTGEVESTEEMSSSTSSYTYIAAYFGFAIIIIIAFGMAVLMDEEEWVV